MPARNDDSSPLGGSAIERAFYDQMDWERYAANPEIAYKMQLTVDLVPADARVILDAGCGNGALTNLLRAPGRLVIGLDSSTEPLRTVQACAVRGAVEALPVADQSADLVVLSEVLEHLPDAALQQCIAEVMRASRRYVLIASPNREALRTRFLRCPHCGHEFNAYLHVQSLSAAALQRRFPGWTARRVQHCGHEEVRRWNWLSWLSQKVGNAWFDVEGSFICTRCGDPVPTHYRANVIGKALRRLNWVAAKAMGRVAPFFFIVLLERPGTQTSEGGR